MGTRKDDEEIRRIFSDTTIEQATDAILWIDSEARIHRVNAALCRLVGYSREELLSMHVYDLETSVETFKRTWKDIRERKIHIFEKQFRRKDGKIIPVEVAANFLVYQGAEYNCTIIHDISERKAREEALEKAFAEIREARDKIDNIIESVADGLLVSDNQDRVVLMNHAAKELFGIPYEEVIGHPLATVLQDRFGHKDFGACFCRKRLESGSLDLEIPGPASPLPRMIEARNSIMRNQTGQRTGLITILRDVTRERELDRMKREFISRTAHEMNTPLTTIMGYAEALLNPQIRSNIDSQQMDEYLEEIHNKGEALTKIVDDILELSQIESGQAPKLEKAPCLLGDLIEKVVAPYRLPSGKNQIEVNLSQTTPETIWIDEKKIGEVLDNLLSNAVKFSPQGAKVEVKGEMVDEDYMICVKDEGIGMTREQAERIFDQFYRADGTDTAVGGLGLGMNIAKLIVESHGGKIWVESEPEKGTEIFFTLPTAPIKK